MDTKRRGRGERAGTRHGIAVALIAGLLATGCAPAWVPIDESTPRPFDYWGFELKVPAPVGWMSSYYGPVAGHIFYTVHGQELEEVWIRRFPRTAIVKGTNRTAAGELSVQEMAGLSLDSRRLDDGVGALEVVSNRPATIDGRDCYRIDYRSRNEIGLEKRTVEYGCPVGGWLYRFEFMAPEQHYFERYLPDFEEMTRGIRFSVKGA